MERADALLVLGEDLTHTAPLAELYLRQGLRQQPGKKARSLKIPPWNDSFMRLVEGEDKGPLFTATPGETSLDAVASANYRGAPADIARIGFALAHHIDPRSPRVENLSEEMEQWIRQGAKALMEGDRPLVVAGCGLGETSSLWAAANVAEALHGAGKEVGIFLTLPECNSLGLGMMGAGDLSSALERVEEGEVDTVVIVENDLFRRHPPQDLLRFFEKTRHVVVLDHVETMITERAEMVLPAATFAESNGVLVNNEGRAQQYYSVFQPQNPIQASWKWLGKIMMGLGRTEAHSWTRSEAICEALAKEIPIFANLTELGSSPAFRAWDRKVPRQSHRYSGRTALKAHIDVNEPKSPDDRETPLSYSMEGSPGIPSSSLITRYWTPGWNSVSALNRFQQEVGGELRGGDPGQRLLKPEQGGDPSYFAEVPKAFIPRDHEWLLVPFYHLFGSEELSARTRGVAELSPVPFLGLSPFCAKRIKASEGEIVAIELYGEVYRFPLKILSGLPAGIAGLAAGLLGVPPVGSGIWTPVSRIS
jgi:NADH-quinone oxidoreductase subunit G